MSKKYNDYTKSFNREREEAVKERFEKEKEEVAELPREDVKPKFEKKEEPVDLPARNPEGVVCNADKVRVRQKPSTEARVIQIVPRGTKVEILDHKDGWYSVKISVAEYAYAGYIMDKFVAIV